MLEQSLKVLLVEIEAGSCGIPALCVFIAVAVEVVGEH